MKFPGQLYLPILLLSLVGCSNGHEPNAQPRFTNENWYVAEVRGSSVVQVRGADNQSGEAAVGAAAGGYLFGSIGAIAGAAAGASNDDGSTVAEVRPLACMIIANDPRGKIQTITYTDFDSYSTGDLAKRCSLVQVGDSIRVSLVWEAKPNDVPRNFRWEGEIIPRLPPVRPVTSLLK